LGRSHTLLRVHPELAASFSASGSMNFDCATLAMGRHARLSWLCHSYGASIRGIGRRAIAGQHVNWSSVVSMNEVPIPQHFVKALTDAALEVELAALPYISVRAINSLGVIGLELVG
jgi:hypothetical protein